MVPLYDNNPTRRPAVVTTVLIVLNVGVYLFQYLLELGGAVWVIPGYGLVPARFGADPAGEALTILTGMFLHGGWGHLGWNMLFLYIFGDNVEDALGHLRYAIFYLAAGAGAAATQFMVDPVSSVPTVGASGAIAGVLGAYLVLYPRAPVAVLNPIFLLWPLLGIYLSVPAWFVVGEWFVGNLFGGLGSLGNEAQGGVAFFAHIGGFVVGLVGIKPLLGRRSVEPAARWRGWQAPPRPQRRHKAFWREQPQRPFWK